MCKACFGLLSLKKTRQKRSFPPVLQHKGCAGHILFTLLVQGLWYNKYTEKDRIIRKSHCPIYFWYHILHRMKRWLPHLPLQTVCWNSSWREGRALIVIPTLLSLCTSCILQSQKLAVEKASSVSSSCFYSTCFNPWWLLLQCLKNETSSPGGPSWNSSTLLNRNLQLDHISSIPQISIFKVLILLCWWLLHPNICIIILAFTLRQYSTFVFIFLWSQWIF